MTGTEVQRELEVAFAAASPLEQIWEKLRHFKEQGIVKQEVIKVLEGLRQEAADEAVEDRILEVMDYVYGFCSPSLTIWPE